MIRNLWIKLIDGSSAGTIYAEVSAVPLKRVAFGLTVSLFNIIGWHLRHKMGAALSASLGVRFAHLELTDEKPPDADENWMRLVNVADYEWVIHNTRVDLTLVPAGYLKVEPDRSLKCLICKGNLAELGLDNCREMWARFTGALLTKEEVET